MFNSFDCFMYDLFFVCVIYSNFSACFESDFLLLKAKKRKNFFDYCVEININTFKTPKR